MPEGTEKKPKGHHQRAQRATRVPPRCKSDDKRTPKGAQRAPKGDQNVPKIVPKSADTVCTVLRGVLKLQKASLKCLA